MPLKSGLITSAERTFADHYARTGDVRYAAERAGYAFATGGHKALARKGVQDRIAAVRERYVARGVTVGFETLIEIAQDQTAGKMPRVSAGDKLLRAGGQYQATAVDDAPKEIHEMTAGELARAYLALDPTVADLELEPATEPAPLPIELVDVLFS